MTKADNAAIYIPLEGVDSEHCALMVDKGLGKVEGITAHKIELNNSRAVINTNGNLEVVPNAIKAIRDLGYGVDTVKKIFPVLNMTCASCAASSQSKPVVTDVLWWNNDTSGLPVLAAIEKQSEHPLAEAIVKHIGQVDYLHVQHFESITGFGAKAQAGIKNYKAEVLPAQKADFIKTLQQQGRIVAMVGDGINDSNALAQADVSIAMGRGSDIAMDVAKMTIISSDLTKIFQAIHLSAYTVATIRQNLFWAFIYNLIGIPIAAGILYPVNGFLLNPMIAGAAMALSSVSVVTNSLMLRSKRL